MEDVLRILEVDGVDINGRPETTKVYIYRESDEFVVARYVDDDLSVRERYAFKTAAEAEARAAELASEVRCAYDRFICNWKLGLADVVRDVAVDKTIEGTVERELLSYIARVIRCGKAEPVMQVLKSANVNLYLLKWQD